MFDADGSAARAEIPDFLPRWPGADFAKAPANGAAGGSEESRRCATWATPPQRHVQCVFATRFSDLCYGYNAFWRDNRARAEPAAIERVALGRRLLWGDASKIETVNQPAVSSPPA